MKFSVVIPSKNAENLKACICAVRKNEPDCRIIVVDDGLDAPLETWQAWDGNVEVIQGVKPFVFAMNCNLGILAAGDDDVVLLNDDALLETPGGFSALGKLSRENMGYGIFSPVTNVTGAPDQMPQAGGGLREVTHIAFVCVYIPRRTLREVGLLDQRFTTYGWDDNDYCLRVKKATLAIGVYDGCFVDHGSLVSSFRGGPHSAGDIEPGRKIFREKWGMAEA